MTVQRAFSGSPWETKAGYCRALRVGNQIFVSGTAPSDGEGGTFAPHDAYAQTKRCFDIIGQALEELGSGLQDVIRTRLYVTDMDRWEEFANAHQELFGDNPPVNTMVAIPRLINPDMMVEVEVEVLLPEEEPIQRPIVALGRPIQRPVDPAVYPPVIARELDESCFD